jgi:putative FmdB family regulatory protein
MPTYEYLCQSCGTRTEVWQKMTDDPLTICPACGGPIRRVLYPAGIVFKGGGFYSTDSRAANAHASSDGSSEGSGTKPAEAKAEAKADTKAGADSTSASTTKSE